MFTDVFYSIFWFSTKKTFTFRLICLARAPNPPKSTSAVKNLSESQLVYAPREGDWDCNGEAGQSGSAMLWGNAGVCFLSHMERAFCFLRFLAQLWRITLVVSQFVSLSGCMAPKRASSATIQERAQKALKDNCKGFDDPELYSRTVNGLTFFQTVHQFRFCKTLRRTCIHSGIIAVWRGESIASSTTFNCQLRECCIEAIVSKYWLTSQLWVKLRVLQTARIATEHVSAGGRNTTL